MKKYAYSTLDIAWIIDGMTLGCRRQYQVMEAIWKKEKTHLELKYLESYRRFVLEIQYWMHYLHEKNLLDQEFTAIQQEIAALNGSLQAEDYQRDFLGLDLFFKQARIRILYGYRKDYVKIKLRTLLKEYGYKRRSQNLVLHIQECMEVYGLEATLRGGVPCNIAEVGIDVMLTFRVVEKNGRFR